MRPLIQRTAAEAAGTALLVGIGTGSIVAGANAGGVGRWVLALAWFAAVAIPVLAFAFVSGSHINPAVTLALVSSPRFPAREALPYIAAQFLGAFAASTVVSGPARRRRSPGNHPAPRRRPGAYLRLRVPLHLRPAL